MSGLSSTNFHICPSPAKNQRKYSRALEKSAEEAYNVVNPAFTLKEL